MSKFFSFEDEILHTELAGLKLKNPIGLAAGFDKNIQFLSSMEQLGFGYVTGGTITKEPRPGNPSPRLLRIKEDKTLINSMGFPGEGLQVAAKRLQTLPINPAAIRLVSVSGTTIEDIVTCQTTIQTLCSAIEVNISSPNTEGLRIFQEKPQLVSLLEALNRNKKVPIFVKLPPFNASLGKSITVETQDLIEACLKCEVDAITVANTIPVDDTRLAVGRGGLSGSKLFENTLAMINTIKKEYGDEISVNACGGISTGAQAFKLIQAGANSVQLYTSLVYEGPGLVKNIKTDLAKLLKSQ
jgi:dihydroorotate dehydrogenase